MLSLFGCSGASDNTTVEPTQPPVTQQLLLSTVEPTPTPTPAAGSSAVFISKWGTQGTGDGQFRDPEGVAVASDGSVYVADYSNNRIQKFTSEGVFVSLWGTEGAGDGYFRQARAVAVASDGSVYVADYSNNRIQKFLPGP